MTIAAQKITPCLWFDTQAEDAAKFYASVFKSSKVGKISRYGKEGFEIHRKKAGTVMTVELEIAGQKFLALNGGPQLLSRIVACSCSRFGCFTTNSRTTSTSSRQIASMSWQAWTSRGQAKLHPLMTSICMVTVARCSIATPDNSPSPCAAWQSPT